MAAALMMAPLAVRGADLVVWWEEGFNPEEDAAIKEIVGAFEHESGKQVKLVQYPQNELPDKVLAALEAGEPPDFAFGFFLLDHFTDWAHDDRLVDLSPAVASFSNLLDPDTLDYATRLNAATGERALYGLPMGRATLHVHVWKSLLEDAGFTLDDIPNEWDAFWSFWCDQVQPAVRRATGRDDIWGVGFPMSVIGDTVLGFQQFLAANEADYVTRDGELVIDDPEIRQRLIAAIEAYTAIYREGCTPPDSATWDSGADNNERFLDQTVVMTVNESLSIPNALKSERPEDYYENTRTIEWPLGPRGNNFPIFGDIYLAMVFNEGDNVATAEKLVHFLAAEGWLAHYLNFSGERLIPPMQALLDQPSWLDPTDRHRMAAVMQVASRPTAHDYSVASGNWRHDRATHQERVWATAIQRVVTQNITPEQAVDEAIARIKEILGE
jgi:multiple sugar transport system substrate-binding protein